MQIGTIASVLLLFLKFTTVMPFFSYVVLYLSDYYAGISKGVVYLLLPSDNDGFTQNFDNINVRKVILMGLPPVCWLCTSLPLGVWQPKWGMHRIYQQRCDRVQLCPEIHVQRVHPPAPRLNDQLL